MSLIPKKTVVDELLLGSRSNGTTKPDRVFRYNLRIGDYTTVTISNLEELFALKDFINSMANEPIDGICQEVHEHMYPHAHDPAFDSWAEEQAELKAVSK